jgi:hypothetical protein
MAGGEAPLSVRFSKVLDIVLCKMGYYVSLTIMVQSE